MLATYISFYIGTVCFFKTFNVVLSLKVNIISIILLLICLNEANSKWKCLPYIYLYAILYTCLLNDKEFCFSLIGLNSIFSTLPQSEHTSRAVSTPRVRYIRACVYFCLLSIRCFNVVQPETRFHFQSANQIATKVKTFKNFTKFHIKFKNFKKKYLKFKIFKKNSKLKKIHKNLINFINFKIYKISKLTKFS